MCGLAGLFDIKGSRDYDVSVIQAMVTAIVHRGPDGSGVYLRPGLALGHRRLAIIDVQGGAQPMHTRDGAVTVVFNGEIYNFRTLRADLEQLGFGFDTRSDTEVLLQGWRAWREGLFARLQGQFALALWDDREETLILARDHFGKKPLHYHIGEDGGLAFASEIKALLTLPNIERTLDPQAVEDFFTYGYVPDPKTIYRTIRKLPAAHYMVVRRGQAPRTQRYWSLLDHAPTGETSAADLAARLGEAVERRLIADVPLGALLSGGVDSSAVVALMASGRTSPVDTFSIAFGEAAFDESPYACAVAERYGTRHRVRRVDADDISLVGRLAQIYDEPFGDISAIPTFTVCAEARKAVTVALSGDGGDEALAGYRRYAFQSKSDGIRAHLGPTVRRRLFGPLAAAYPYAAWLPRPLRAKSTLRELSMDSASAYARMACVLPEEQRLELLSGDFRKALDGYDASEVVRTPFNVSAPLDSLQRAQYADLMTYLPGDILTKVDRASMANSLELRSPMLDPEFVAMSFFLPASEKLSRTHGGKAILKRAMEPYLPNQLLYRKKQGFTVPVAKWLRGPLRPGLAQLPSSPRLQGSGLFEMSTLQRMVNEHLDGLRDHSQGLWLIWVFDAFLAQTAQAS